MESFPQSRPGFDQNKGVVEMPDLTFEVNQALERLTPSEQRRVISAKLKPVDVLAAALTKRRSMHIPDALDATIRELHIDREDEYTRAALRKFVTAGLTFGRQQRRRA